MLGVGLYPALRSPGLGILAKNGLVAVHNPGVHADDGVLGEVLAEHLDAALGDDALEVQTERRVDAAGLGDDGLQEGQLLGLLPGDDGGQLVAFAGLNELLAQGGEGSRVLDEVLEDGAEEDGGGVATSEDVGDGPGLDAPTCLLAL